MPADTQHTTKLVPRCVCIIEWLLLALLTAYIGGHTLRHTWKTLNTDFPDYYLTAHLAREGKDTSRVYEWIWLQRQKDHLQIDQRVIGLGLITPFSTIIIWPLVFLSPLAAKHCWLIINLGMLIATAGLLQSLTRLSWRRILLVFFLSVPLQKNILFGQYYLLLLFVLVLACWCYVYQKRFLSGFLIGFGFGLKIFPIVYLAYFLRKRDLKAFSGGLIGAAGAATVSIAIFGLQVNRVLLFQILPWALRGEGMDPYNASSGSIATLLHRFFIYEPEWNPHPFIHAAWAFAVLLPIAQMLLLAPALLLAEPRRILPESIQLEWSAVLLGSLAISTLPASYHFTLLIFPVCCMWMVLEARAGFMATCAMLLLYVAIGYPGWTAIGAETGLTLLSVPRLYLVILMCVFNYWLLIERIDTIRSRDVCIWSGAFVVLMLTSIASGLHHQRGLYTDYQYRIPIAGDPLQMIGPISQGDAVLFTAMLPDGYHAASVSNGFSHFDANSVDQLASTATASERWTEEAGRESRIISTKPGRGVIRQAELPVASPNGRWLAFLRESEGRARIWVRALDQPAVPDRLVTPPELNVFEMTFLPNGSLVFAASRKGDKPELFATDQSGDTRFLGYDEARYPSVSPDGHWLAYSKLQGGNWNLWLRDLFSGQTSRLTHAECNSVQPAWTADSRTLIYASDCGRGLWFTALCKRRISQ